MGKLQEIQNVLDKESLSDTLKVVKIRQILEPQENEKSYDNDSKVGWYILPNRKVVPQLPEGMTIEDCMGVIIGERKETERFPKRAFMAFSFRHERLDYSDSLNYCKSFHENGMWKGYGFLPLVSHVKEAFDRIGENMQKLKECGYLWVQNDCSSGNQNIPCCIDLETGDIEYPKTMFLCATICEFVFLPNSGPISYGDNPAILKM